MLLTAAAASRTKRSLPTTVNAGYVGGACDPEALVQSALTGINVLFWFSINLGIDSQGRPQVQGGPDLACVATVAAALAAANLPTTHMISVGGWDAPHPDTSSPPAAVYAAWKAWNADVVVRPGFEGGFDGVDWDLEGNDDPANPGNNFTVPCLDLVGQFSQAAQLDGFVVTLVPPESYLDPYFSSYDRSLLHTYPDGWQPSFAYHGRNAYALLMAKYGNTALPNGSSVLTFDLIMVQLYESWSHADFNLTAPVSAGGPQQGAAEYLAAWVPLLTRGWFVDFASDPASGVPSQTVALSPSQVVLGLANGWAGGPKSVLFMPADVGSAFAALAPRGLAPRGTVFWTLTNEGAVPPGQTAPLWMGAQLNDFLHTR
jgi:hypothetical protein